MCVYIYIYIYIMTVSTYYFLSQLVIFFSQGRERCYDKYRGTGDGRRRLGGGGVGGQTFLAEPEVGGAPKRKKKYIKKNKKNIKKRKCWCVYVVSFDWAVYKSFRIFIPRGGYTIVGFLLSISKGKFSKFPSRRKFGKIAL